METQEALLLRYNESKPLFERASLNAVDALSLIIKDSGVEFLHVYSRVKAFDSFYEKITRKNYDSPFTENEDFCGVRIILYHLKDIQLVKELIELEFEVESGEDKTKSLEVKEFGYRSYHLIVKFKKEWLLTPNFRNLENIKIEIQIRTVLMHAWAEIEHKLGYKSHNSNSSEFTRKLSLISAKLEDADNQFQELKNSIDLYQVNLLSNAVKKGKFSSDDFNYNTFIALLDYYFPNLKKDHNSAIQLFNYIENEGVNLKDIIYYAEKIKPYVSKVHLLLFGKRTNLVTSQTNIMRYAIEAYYPKSLLNTGSQSRRKIINTLKEWGQRS